MFLIYETGIFHEIEFEDSSYVFGDQIGRHLCSGSVDPSVCVTVLSGITQLKSSDFAATLFIFYEDSTGEVLLSVLSRIETVLFSCILAGSAKLHYTFMDIELTIHSSGCNIDETTEIKLEWTNTTTDVMKVFKVFKSLDNGIQFISDDFKDLYIRALTHSDY